MPQFRIFTLVNLAHANYESRSLTTYCKNLCFVLILLLEFFALNIFALLKRCVYETQMPQWQKFINVSQKPLCPRFLPPDHSIQGYVMSVECE